MDENNQKEVLLEFAKENNFDPEVPENWYLINMKSLRSFKVLIIIYYYSLIIIINY